MSLNIQKFNKGINITNILSVYCNNTFKINFQRAETPMQYLISDRGENALYKQPWKSVTRIKLLKISCH